MKPTDQQMAEIGNINVKLTKAIGTIYELNEQLDSIQSDTKDVQLASASRLINDAYQKLQDAVSRIQYLSYQAK